MRFSGLGDGGVGKVPGTHLSVLGAQIHPQLVQTSAEGLPAVAMPGPVQAGSQQNICGRGHWRGQRTFRETEHTTEFKNK